ncbi:DUF1844 domain-containing protein [Syntrophorhabdus aromaticivorans]|jgi:hypothetical protein|uniref:DUF1844 domain-containing protein n=1 Tax=Syntrophorhabdus aromaticivorans TaxID=328301 RepID=A0A971S1A3_9BACT|nr:DUF1844 domain-containing protein [Syntrophorhabdus aromaticivorans]NLW35042.1 DUF1844 domain-containing protein [Syntrophorhabdus aromaticivorans]
MEEEQKGFTITDKRGTFGDGGDTGTGTDHPREERTCEEKAEEEAFATVLNFSTFILSLTTSALVSLGELPDPLSKEKVANLPLAQQTISIIEILKEKTAGNLTEDEDRLISTVLYDLRMKYVQAACS